MNVSEQFKQYIDKVCEQIRWKKAHDVVAQEIENHLIDQKNAYINMGDPESVAEEKALLQMGDPASVGAALDNTHKPAPQKGMIVLVMLLFFLGLLIQYRLTIHSVLEVKSGSIPYQFMLYGVGLLVFIGAYHLDFSFFGKHPYILPLLILGYYICLHYFGSWYNGVKWFVIGSFSISPAAVSLLAPLAFCGVFYRLRENELTGYFLSGVLAFFCCCLLLSIHVAGSIFVFVCAAGSLMIAAVRKNWFGNRTKPILAFFITVALITLGFLLFSMPYRMERFRAALFPYTDPSGAGYLSIVIRGTLENAVFFGKGAGYQGGEPISYLPHTEFRTDFLLTYLTHIYGWAVSLLLVGLLAAFLFLGFRKFLKQKSVLGQMVALSILCTFAAETLLYIIDNLGLALIAPIALPFLSYGGTALVIHMGLAGILLSVFRTGEVYRDSMKPLQNESKFIQWDDGRLIISFKN